MSQQDKRDSKLLVAFFIAMGVIFVLLLWIIFKKPQPDPKPDNSQRIRDSITLLTGQIEDEKKKTDHYLHVADSLSHLPPVITIIYREQKKFTSIATINQLDSIIRTNAGIPRRNMVKYTKHP